MNITNDFAIHYQSLQAHAEYLDCIAHAMESEGPWNERIEMREKGYQQLLQNFREQLDWLREQYCGLTVSATLIRRLHNKYPNLGSDVSTEEYIRIFTRLSLAAGKVDYDEERIISIFECVLRNNTYPEKAREEPITKDKVIELCLCLGWTTNDVDYILLRCLDNDGLDRKDICDLATAFVLDVLDAKQSDIRSIRQTMSRRLSAQRVDDSIHVSSATTLLSNELKAIVETEGIRLSDRKRMYIDCLTKYQGYLNSPSETARMIYIKALAFATTVHDEFDGPVERELEKWINNQEQENLDEQSRKAMVSTLVFGSLGNKQSTNSIIDASIEWSVPRFVWKNGDVQIHRVTLFNRIMEIVNGSLPVTKKDLLLLLFQTCAHYWELERVTDDVEILTARYNRFVELCDATLEKAMLPGFYLPHPLEYSIALSVLSGENSLDTFQEMLLRFQWAEPKSNNATRIDFEFPSTSLSPEFLDLYNKLDDIVLNCVQNMGKTDSQLVVYSNPESMRLLDKANRVAKAMADAWNNIHYEPADFYFRANGIVEMLPGGSYDHVAFIQICSLEIDFLDLLQ